MKTLILALLLFVAGSAHAEEAQFFIENDGGGEIIFTIEECPSNPSMLFGYGYHREGHVIPGCWTFDKKAGLIIMRYQDNDVRAYSVNLVQKR